MLRPILPFAALLLAAVPGAGQTASLRGRVLDESGAAVPGAAVTLACPGGAPRTTAAGDDGIYAFERVSAGACTVTVASPGLATLNPVPASFDAGAVTLDLHVRVTRVDKVTVEDTGTPLVSTDNSTNAGAVVIRGKDLNALADNPEDLQADLQALAGPTAGPGKGAIYVDGFSGGRVPPKESIREIRINQNPFAAEFDKVGMGRIEIFTKPGAEKWKGNLGYNFADDVWNSRNPFASRKAPLRLQEFENSLGGPLGHATSFTLDLEHHAVDNGFIVNGIALDPATYDPAPYNAIHLSEQRRIMISPRIDHQLARNDTVSLRYTFVNSNVAGAGVGGFDDVSRAYRLHNRFYTAQFSNTLVIGQAINETRFQFYRWEGHADPDQLGPAIQVLGALTTGGATVGTSADTQNHFEWQNYTTVARGTHVWRFGVRLRDDHDESISRKNFNGTFTFTSIDTYRATLLSIPGFGPSQFSETAGTPGLSGRQVDAGLFVSDEWRVRPNFTLQYGLRYEGQTNISDHSDVAPRFSVAWSPGRASRTHATVIRAGAGVFYERFALADTLTARRSDGGLQQQYVLSSPPLFPRVPAPATLDGVFPQQVIQRVDANLRSPYFLQSSVTVEQQVARHTTAAATFANSHGVHMLRSLVAPGTSPVFLMTSSGLYNQNQFIVNMRTNPLPQVSLFGYYVLSRARSDTDGLATFPANPDDYTGEYGSAATDIRHRVLIGGSLAARWNLQISPYLMAQSGAPFNITTGQDLYGTTLFNSRPSVTTTMRPGVVATDYGLLNPYPQPGEPILSRNYGRGPGQITLNLRMGKTIGIGPMKGGSPKKSGAAPGIDAANMSAPGGLRGLFASATSDRRYSLTISMSARNLLNHTNVGPVIGTITSPLFGGANQIATIPNAEGFSENASNRRLELQIKFAF